MDHGMVWGVKDSLVAYIEKLEDGVVETVAPAGRGADGFAFPLAEGGAAGAVAGRAVAGEADAADVAATPGGTPMAETGELGAAPAGGSLRFDGALRLSGHWGMLDVELREPRIELEGGAGTLLVRERGGLDPDKVLPFADLDFVGMEEAGGASRLEFSAKLTAEGSFLLGGQYPAGQALNPVYVVVPAVRG